MVPSTGTTYQPPMPFFRIYGAFYGAFQFESQSKTQTRPATARAFLRLNDLRWRYLIGVNTYLAFSLF